jgi:hypothetical protein
MAISAGLITRNLTVRVQEAKMRNTTPESSESFFRIHVPYLRILWNYYSMSDHVIKIIQGLEIVNL